MYMSVCTHLLLSFDSQGGESDQEMQHEPESARVTDVVDESEWGFHMTL